MSQPKILITEGHPLAQQALAATLKSLGQNNVFIATDSKHAIERMLQEKQFDLLICTVTVPNAPEIALLGELNKHGHIDSLLIINETPIDLENALRQFSIYCGFSNIIHLRKPFAKSDVQTALSTLTTTLPDRIPTKQFEQFSAKAIENSVRKKRFIPYYQPKVALESMEVVGAEILMRWNHPNLGTLGPATFIDLAARLGYLQDMTLSVLEQAIDFVQSMSLGDDFKLAINIDATQICDPTFYTQIASLLHAKEFRAKNLILEITESGVLSSPEKCLANLIYLRLLGCGISIDDFGAGLSSLQRVCELPCTELKLDISFVKSLVENQRTRHAINRMIMLSRDINVQLVAEGIETEEQCQLLQQLGCPTGQGYYFSAPVSGKNLIKWLKHPTKHRVLKKVHKHNHLLSAE